MGRTLIFLGIVLLVIGAIVSLFEKIPGLGKLPRDILIERKNFTFYFPIVTCVVVSLLLSLFFWFIGKR